MIRSLALFSLLGIWPLFASGQWSGDPGQPRRVCSKNAAQLDPVVLSRPQGGATVLWRDERFGFARKCLVGQVLDGNGVSLFPDSGVVIYRHPGRSVNQVAIAPDGQGFAWFLFSPLNGPEGGSDSLLLQKINLQTLQTVYPTPKLICSRSLLGSGGVSVSEINLLPTGDSLLLAFYLSFQGATRPCFNRVDRFGNPKLGAGKQVMGCNTCFGPISLISDGKNGGILLQRNSNGNGAGLRAHRLNHRDSLKWVNQTLVSSNTPGLSSAYVAIPDQKGGAFVVFETGTGGLRMAGIDSNGNRYWPTGRHPRIARFTSLQTRPQAIWNDGHIYVVWTDNRPPADNSDTYMQKLSPDSTLHWDPAGVPIIRVNSYIPVPVLQRVDSNQVVVVAHHSTVGVLAQKVRPDGSKAWAGNGLLLAENNGAFQPMVDRIQTMKGTQGNFYAVWQGMNSRIYISNAGQNGQLVTHIEENNMAPESGSLFPNPTHGNVWVSASEKGNVRVFSLTGSPVHVGVIRHENGLRELDLGPVAPGLYLVNVDGKVYKVCKK